MATQYALMKPGSEKNWYGAATSWEAVDRLSFENSGTSGVERLVAALRGRKVTQTIAKSQQHQPICRSNVMQVSNFDLNPWNKIRKEVATWGNLKADWDDDGAVIPRSDGLKFLEMMIADFNREGSPNAMPYIAGDGEFGVHWRLRGGRAVLSILADGRVLAFCPRRSGDPIRIRSTLDQQIDMKAFYSALREIAQ